MLSGEARSGRREGKMSLHLGEPFSSSSHPTLPHPREKKRSVSLSLLRLLLLLLLDSNRPLPSSTVGRAYEQSLTHPPPPPPSDHSHHLPSPPLPFFDFSLCASLRPPIDRRGKRPFLSLSGTFARAIVTRSRSRPVGRSKWPDDDAGCSDGSQTQKTKGDFSIDDGLDVSQNLRCRSGTMFPLEVI